MNSINDLTAATEAKGAPKEFTAHVNKIGVEVFAGVSALNMSSLTTGNYTTIKTAIANAGGPPEADAHLDKVSSLLINA